MRRSQWCYHLYAHRGDEIAETVRALRSGLRQIVRSRRAGDADEALVEMISIEENVAILWLLLRDMDDWEIGGPGVPEAAAQEPPVVRGRVDGDDGGRAVW